MFRFQLSHSNSTFMWNHHPSFLLPILVAFCERSVYQLFAFSGVPNHQYTLSVIWMFNFCISLACCYVLIMPILAKGATTRKTSESLMPFQVHVSQFSSHSFLQGIFPTQWSNPGSPAFWADFLLSEPPGKTLPFLLYLFYYNSTYIRFLFMLQQWNCFLIVINLIDAHCIN